VQESFATMGWCVSLKAMPHREEVLMKLRNYSEYLRKEHEELLNLADRIEKLLESASKHDFAEHTQSVSGLRSLDHLLANVVNHCRTLDRVIEPADLHLLHPDERARLEAEHEQIERLIANFREELKCATADRTMAMILPGMDVVKWLRAHITYERELLDRLVELMRPSRKGAGKRKVVVRTHKKSRKRSAPRKTVEKEPHYLPYTLEPHPEL
jgi:hypothetical protein